MLLSDRFLMAIESAGATLGEVVVGVFGVEHALYRLRSRSGLATRWSSTSRIYVTFSYRLSTRTIHSLSLQTP